MNRGWVKLWRKTADSMVFQHEGLLKLFVLCLLKASHAKEEVLLDGMISPIIIEPGQFITGRYQLHSDYHQLHVKKRKPKKLPLPSPYTLWRWLLTLQEMQILCIKSTNKYSIITISNWKQYQGNEHQVSIKRASSEHIQEEYKNYKEVYSSETDGIPFQEIVNVYHETLPELPKVRKLSGKRKKSIKARWNEEKKRQSLEWWTKYFKHVSRSDWLMGRENKWRSDFEWLINSSNMLNVIEGRYH